MTRRLLLLRHGQTHYNATMRMQGQLDTELSELGVQQARETGRFLAARRPRLVVSSDLSRARETARALAAEVGLDVRTDPRLRETDLGRWQARTHTEVDTEWPGARGRWRCSPRWAPPEGESRVEVARRTRAVVDELVDAIPDWDAHPVVLVAHGGAIAALTAALLELPVEHFPIFNGLGNTCWAQLSAHPRPDPAWGGPGPAEIGPSTPGASRVLWRLDVWNGSAPHPGVGA